jgi:CRP-like cAMP-binding protein
VRASEVVGERGPIEGRPRSATVTATTHVLVYAISRARLSALLLANADAAAHMRRVVKARYATPALNAEPALAG